MDIRICVDDQPQMASADGGCGDHGALMVTPVGGRYDLHRDHRKDNYNAIQHSYKFHSNISSTNSTFAVFDYARLSLRLFGR